MEKGYFEPKSFEVEWIILNTHQNELKMGIVQPMGITRSQERREMRKVLAERGLEFEKEISSHQQTYPPMAPQLAIFKSQVPSTHIISNQLGCTRFDANTAKMGRILCELPKGARCEFEKHVLPSYTDHIIRCNKNIV